MGTFSTTVTGRSSRTAEMFFVAGASATAGFILVLFSGTFLQYTVMAIALGPIIMVSLRWPSVFVYLVVFSSALAGAQGALMTVSVGATRLSVSGLRWIIVACFVTMVLVGHLRRIKVVPYLHPFLVFSLVVVTRFLVSYFEGRQLAGLNDVLFYTLPLLFAWFVLLASGGDVTNVTTGIRLGFGHGVVLLWASYLLFIPLGLIEFKSSGPDGLFRPRPVGLFALMALTLTLATWRYGASRSTRRRGALFSALAMALVFFTMSRTSAFAALLFLVGHRLDPKRMRQFVAVTLVAVSIFSILVLTVPIFRSRFFYDPDLGVDETVGMLRTAGRDSMWPVVMDHALERPLMGWGLGSARVEAAGAFAARDVERFHPHNEFLQVFHDMGLVGLGALIVALAAISTFHLRAWRRADREKDDRAALWNMAAFLGLWAVVLTSVTGNTLHYPFATLPVFAVSAIGFEVANLADHSGVSER